MSFVSATRVGRLAQRAKVCFVHGTDSFRGEGAWRVGLLVVVLVILAFYKWPLASDFYHTSIDKAYDGGYYLNVGQNVRDGNGLVTNVALFHKAYPYFPHPTSIYPLWPLLLGYASRFAPIESLAVQLPTLLYFVALVFAYLWGRALYRSSLFPACLPGFNAGHLAVILFGLHRTFFYYTSGPYTEAFSYAILFGGLWATHRVWLRPSLLRGLALGLWLGAAMLARSQLFLAAIAAFATLAWAVLAVTPRRPYAWATVAAAAGFAALAGGHLWYLSGFVAGVDLGTLLRFDQNRASALLSPVKVMIREDSLWEFLKDKGNGFLVGFSFTGEYAYSRSFYTFGYAALVAFPFLILEGARSVCRENLIRAWAWMRSPRSLPWLFCVLFALGGFFSLHVLHKSYYAAWNFSLRQGLTAGFFFFFALLFLLTRRRAPAASLGVLLLCGGIVLGWWEIRGQASKAADRAPPTAPYKSRLAEWLLQKRREKEQLIVAMDGPHKMAPYTPGINYHAFIRGKTRLSDMERMVTELGVRYFLLRSRGPYRARRNREQFDAGFRRVARRVAGYDIYEPNPELLKRIAPAARPLKSSQLRYDSDGRPW